MSRLVDLASIPPFEVWGDQVVARKVQGERLTMAVVELAPGAAVPEHRHEADQVGICLRGEMTFTIDGETRTFGPGGTWNIPSMAPHMVEVGPDGAIAIDVFSPIRSDWAFEDLAPRRPVWPPDAD
jgi:quercetin dioxygenase-like cupin family protein